MRCCSGECAIDIPDKPSDRRNGIEAEIHSDACRTSGIRAGACHVPSAQNARHAGIHLDRFRHCQRLPPILRHIARNYMFSIWRHNCSKTELHIGICPKCQSLHLNRDNFLKRHKQTYVMRLQPDLSSTKTPHM